LYNVLIFINILRYCLSCKVEYHDNITCKNYKELTNVDYLDSQFENFVKGKKFKQCPKCKFWVEKSTVNKIWININII